MLRYVFVVCALLLAAAAGCGDGGGSGGDGGTDTGSDSDSDTHDYWEWESAMIPGSFVGHQWYHRVFAVAANDATICAGNMVNGTGGILSFDGAAFTTEETGFVCEFVWGLDADHVWALGYVDETFEPVLYSRSGGVWSQDTVDGADDSCRLEAIFGASVDDATLVGWCSGGVRQSWVPGGPGAWVAGAEIVPTDDVLDTIYGVVALPDGDVFYGSGLYENAGGTDLGYQAERALWVGGDAMSDLRVLEGDEVRSLVDDTWMIFAACPYDLSADEYAVCWSCGARDGASGDVYLGGGRGGAAGENIDDWRLNRVSAVDGTVSRILEPCGGEEPSCGVDDLSLAADGMLFAIASGPQPRLMWHQIPAAD